MLFYVLSKSYIVQLEMNCPAIQGVEANSSLLYTPSAIVCEGFHWAGLQKFAAFPK